MLLLFLLPPPLRSPSSVEERCACRSVLPASASRRRASGSWKRHGSCDKTCRKTFSFHDFHRVAVHRSCRHRCCRDLTPTSIFLSSVKRLHESEGNLFPFLRIWVLLPWLYHELAVWSELKLILLLLSRLYLPPYVLAFDSRSVRCRPSLQASSH